MLLALPPTPRQLSSCAELVRSLSFKLLNTETIENYDFGKFVTIQPFCLIVHAHRSDSIQQFRLYRSRRTSKGALSTLATSFARSFDPKVCPLHEPEVLGAGRFARKARFAPDWSSDPGVGQGWYRRGQFGVVQRSIAPDSILGYMNAEGIGTFSDLYVSHQTSKIRAATM